MFKYILALVLVLVAVDIASADPIISPPPIATIIEPTLTQDAYFLNLNTIKMIQCTGSHGVRAGTAFTIGKNRVVTSEHVISKTTSCEIEGKPTKIVSEDPSMDIAILSIDLGSKPPILQINCDGFISGREYFSIGYADGQDFAMTRVVSLGSFVDVNLETMVTQKHMAALWGVIIPGMSGGPIIDDDGRVVGINSMNSGSHFAKSRQLADTKLCEALRLPIEPKIH